MTVHAPLQDEAARHTALTSHNRSLLVVAGAGSGKTAIMAGRIALLLAEGAAPRSIAAVTFTELAASELLVRVREFVEKLAVCNVPIDLRVALPNGPSATQIENLKRAAAAIDEITCSTIHGFCQRLIKPYPVEARIDPGAVMIDKGEGDLLFTETTEAWLREKIDCESGGMIAEAVLHDSDAALDVIRKLLNAVRQRHTLQPPEHQPIAASIAAFTDAAAAFQAFVTGAEVKEQESLGLADELARMVNAVSPATTASPAAVISVLSCRPQGKAGIGSGALAAYSKKGKWGAAASSCGRSKAEGERLHDEAKPLFEACRDSWNSLRADTAAHVLAALIEELAPAVSEFTERKRDRGLLDFDDLIHSARALLENHPAVRKALAMRYKHVLVDEFQDTDPLQTEIFWRLCGDPPADKPDAPWSDYTIRPGALFLVGDPKQAIYRFRGADVAAYVSARDAFFAQDNSSILSISTNFRSRAPILQYVNARFEEPLSADGQPGFEALSPFHPDGGVPHVRALDFKVTTSGDKPGSDERRNAEAEAVADMCARLIGSMSIKDLKSGSVRTCRPGDIALLAPSGSDLWRYEEALEKRGVPVATQAGKGFFQRQEVQDLIAITRVLADGRDTLALGALLRGPIVGLTDEELLDIVWDLTRNPESADDLPRLSVFIEPEKVKHPLARDTIRILQGLRRRSNSTTPHDLLSQAVEELRVRPILLSRHGGRAERAGSNIDLFLSLARPYAIRGLRAFADAMTACWTDKERTVEGRPDAREEAVALHTMHASKGLEWPIVVPINTTTQVSNLDSAVTNRLTGRYYQPIFGVAPTGHEEQKAAEKAELERERIRLWYVATTRAQELLILPRPDVGSPDRSWAGIVELALGGLEPLNLSDHSPDFALAASSTANGQSREVFAEQAAAIHNMRARVAWIAPSRDEGGKQDLDAQAPTIAIGDEDALPDDVPICLQGGLTRGLIMHKLFEEVLTGETPETRQDLAARAAVLIAQLGKEVCEDPSQRLNPDEIAGCVVRGLALPEIADLRPGLLPELPIANCGTIDGVEQATAGVGDAIYLNLEGRPEVVVDWKSDVAPAPAAIEGYKDQVRQYLASTGATRGLVVFATEGRIIHVNAPLRN
jgi:exodeoxyribonuclease-5